MSKAAAGRAVAALVDIITKTVAKKQDVQLIGFGTFKAAKRAARKGERGHDVQVCLLCAGMQDAPHHRSTTQFTGDTVNALEIAPQRPT